MVIAATNWKNKGRMQRNTTEATVRCIIVKSPIVIKNYMHITYTYICQSASASFHHQRREEKGTGYFVIIIESGLEDGTQGKWDHQYQHLF